MKSEEFKINYNNEDLRVTVESFSTPNQFVVMLHTDATHTRYLGIFTYGNDKWESQHATPPPEQRLVDAIGSEILNWHLQQGISL